METVQFQCISLSLSLYLSPEGGETDSWWLLEARSQDVHLCLYFLKRKDTQTFYGIWWVRAIWSRNYINWSAQVLISFGVDAPAGPNHDYSWVWKDTKLKDQEGEGGIMENQNKSGLALSSASSEWLPKK